MIARTGRIAVTVAALLFSLAGCGGDDDPADTPTETETETETETAEPDPEPTAAEPTAEPSEDEPTATETEVDPAAEQPVEPDLLDATEFLASLELVGTDYGPAYSLDGDIADLESPAAIAIRDAVMATPECGPPTTEGPLPYSTLSSAANVAFVDAIGATASAGVIVMPVEEAAIGYLAAMRADEGYPTCLGLATLKTLTNAPPGMTLEMENFRFDDPIAGYGDDQVYTASDVVILQEGTVLLTVEGGTRYSRIGNVILWVGGTSLDADAFAPKFYERALAALEGR